MSFESTPRGDDQSRALMELAAIEASIYQTGAFDAEPNALAGIRLRLSKNQITPSQAVEEARAIVAERQDYH